MFQDLLFFQADLFFFQTDLVIIIHKTLDYPLIVASSLEPPWTYKFQSLW